VTRPTRWLLVHTAIGAVIAQASAAPADLARGEELFHTCAACHSVLGDGIGPDITGIYGRPAAMRPEFTYSEALKGRALVWSAANLRAFIESPERFVPGTLMTFPGYPMPADVDDVIAYLKTLK
jgi:cytochrome c